MTPPRARRLLLIEPPYYRLFKATYSLDRFPLGLGYLAAVAREHGGWDVRVLNADFAGEGEPIEVGRLAGEGFARYRRLLEDDTAGVWSELRERVERLRPDVVGITAKSPNYAAARKVAALVKSVNPDAVVLLGGPHASLVGGEVLGCPDIDVAVRGEGERTLVELLDVFAGRRRLEQTAGIVHRSAGRFVQTPPRELIDDLDALPFPHAAADGTLLDFDRYPLTALRSVFATRGCPYGCTFCGSAGIWTRRVRYRSPANVAAELDSLQRLGLRFVHFDDDTFGVRRDYLRELCDTLARRGEPLGWSCEIHVRLVDGETIDRMKSAGCWSIQLGIESGNDAMLRRIGKNITIAQAMDACRTIRRRGVETVAFFMVGFPHETEATLNDTAEAMRRIDADVLVYSIFTPYPGTTAWDECRELGLIGDDFDVSLYNHQSPANCFSAHIPPERFRERVAELERLADRRNRRTRRRKLLSLRTLRRARELGWRGCLRRARRMFLHR